MLTRTADAERNPFLPVPGHEAVFVADDRLPHWECRKCRCWDHSEMAVNPCGDSWGHTVQKIAGVRDGRHVWEIWYRGVLLRVVEADVC